MNQVINSWEFRLVAACCRWPRSEARDAAVRGAAAGFRGWKEFLWLTERHRVGGLVYDALRSARVDPPDRVTKRLAAGANAIARQNLMLAAESVRLQDILDGAGVHSMSLKGAALAQLAYGSLSIKQTRDIDILVAPDDALAALQVLEAEGFALSSPARELGVAQRRALVRFGRELDVLNAKTGLRVDLHWRLTGNAMLLEGIDVASPTQDVALPDGSSLRTLRDADLFAYLCVHGTVHRWSRLKWLADLNALIAEHRTDGAIVRDYRYAGEKGAGICAGQALLLCRNLLRRPLPRDLDADLEGSRRLAALVSIGCRAIGDPKSDSEPGRRDFGVLRAMAADYLYGLGWRFVLMQVKLQLVSLADIVRLPLPHGLHFLYLFVRGPLWLVRRLTSLMAAIPAKER